MTKKIEISKHILGNLYVKEGLSTYKIGRKFNCDATVIQRILREHNIKLRKPKIKIMIPQKTLFNLYVNKKLSTQKIAKLLGISSSAVYYKLTELNIPTRRKNIVKVNKERLKELYLEKHLSCSKIAKKYNCDTVTIFKKIKGYKIKTRNYSLAGIIYPKKEFNGGNKLKAYMIGFRLGDLNVRAVNKKSTVFVKSNTTKEDQVRLIKEVYGKYGHFKISYGKNDFCVWCNLDKSFSFLIKKEDKIDGWIINNNKCFFSFLAGYTDAEGNISICQGRARFRIRTYDKNILFQMYKKLNSLDINTIFNLVSKAGIVHGIKQNKDSWGIFVNTKDDLLKLLRLIKPYIKHKKRMKDLVLAEKNVLERNKKYRNKLNL